MSERMMLDRFFRLISMLARWELEKRKKGKALYTHLTFLLRPCPCIIAFASIVQTLHGFNFCGLVALLSLLNMKSIVCQVFPINSVF